MSFHHHVNKLTKTLKMNIFSSRTKSFHQINLIKREENLELAYASYESTKSYSDKNPEPTPVLVLHGFMASKNNWNSYCKKCHENTKSKVVAIDARNHGDSPHATENSYDDMVMDIREFMYKMDMKKINLLGHSMGGRTAMLFALKYPELVEKLIVADISPITSSPSVKQLPKLLNILKRIEIPEKTTLQETRKILSEKLFTLVGNKQLVSFILTNLVQKNEGSYSWRFNEQALVENFEYISTFPEIYNIKYEGPVLFVGGAKSDHIPKSDYPKILKLFPNAELKFIEGAGHWIHSEKPAEFLKVTIDFLNKKINK
ncbi:sn-1-specific diacylglycerol lipase ABHD11-like isoform X1 [Leptinotarsa decemlineata]|uniref:sn-1-specific diacylglycerol lipase ABHD11 isoform X1 n=1 Tax=Leptinotarsa decemlineata TaxID=7539 RepID=UPI000C2519CE|nr:protein ABHD11 isoform X1 [Leptinotarsa decemlineata]